MTAREKQLEVDRLQADRLQADRTGLRDNDFFIEALDAELAAARAMYVGLAVTEIATLRGQLFGRNFG
jgi:hypothetical protein